MFDMNHLHPMLVHFPIALAIVGFLFECVELFIKKNMQQCRYGEILLYLATLSALASVFTGALFTGTFLGKPGSIRDIHMIFAVIATFSLCITSIFYMINAFSKEKNEKNKKIGFFFYIISVLCIMVTGAMGGTLVYSYMIGI